MHVAILMKQADYAAGGHVDIKGIEVVDPTVYTPNSTLMQYADPITGEIYVKKVVIVTEDSYKTTIISNYSDCYYDKSNDTIVPTYNAVTNRALTEYDTSVPLVTDKP